MTVTLHRWGNSIGLRLPKPLLEQVGLGEGSKVDLKVEAGRLVIEPVQGEGGFVVPAVVVAAGFLWWQPWWS